MGPKSKVKITHGLRRANCDPKRRGLPWGGGGEKPWVDGIQKRTVNQQGYESPGKMAIESHHTVEH